MLTRCSWVSPYINATVYAASNDVSPRITGYAIAILQTGSFVGRIFAGILGDRFGVWIVFTAMGGLAAISLLGLWTPSNLPDAVVLIGLLGYGFGSGAWMTLVAASCASISPIREYGMRIGMLFSLSGLPALAGPVICGGDFCCRKTRARADAQRSSLWMMASSVMRRFSPA
jgi:MFS family permease